MKAKHHLWTSLAVGGFAYFMTHSAESFVGIMVGGFLIDADHLVDQLWSINQGAPHTRKSAALEARQQGLRGWIARFIQRRKLVRLPLVFHSYELMIILSTLVFFLRIPFLIGLLAGYVLHIALDIYRHHHEYRSSFFYSIIYRLMKGFRRDRLIKPEYQ